ncbi:hypothetical protein AZF08_20070 [Bacillus gaemokensis]|nr:hypothetical protein AZF08_20070 [Bacillus gaemokensis]
MSGKNIPNIANYADLHLQSIRKLYITVEVLDEEMNTIETIQGLSTGGDISISNSSLIRRTGNLSFVLLDSLRPTEGSLLWMTNRIRVYAGIEDLTSSDGTITHFCLGTFYITEPSVDISPENRTTTIALQDNMMRWEMEQLENKIVIDADTPIHTAITEILHLYGEWKADIQFTTLTVPYKLEFNEGDTVLDIIETLRDLYMDWEAYYDVDGTFVFRKMQIQREDGEPVSWVFNGESNHITTFGENYTYKNVKNKVVVIGRMDDKTGLTPKAEVSLAKEDSPFHESKIKVRKKVVVDTKLTTLSQCESSARYELFKASNFQEQLAITSVPVYFLDGNDIIEVYNFVSKKVERYIIDSISTGLGVKDNMTINAHKMYYDTIEVDSSLTEAREIATIVEDGIMNKGWLSLSEQRIKNYYGLVGSGADVTVRFENGEKHGVTAYVAGYMGTKRQVLTIDLADFKSNGDDNGNTGAGKEEYSDRILGHEVVHLLMNDVFGVEKTRLMPTWFTEGSAELLHGADERLKFSIVDNGVINNTKLNNLISLATRMLKDNYWEDTSDSYSAGYVIMKYLDKKIVDGKDMKSVMNSIKSSTKSGGEAVKDAIIANTAFTTYDAFINDFTANAVNYVKSIRLNLTGDEIDTGSIAGYDHRGTTALNAEAIFDNSKAVQGKALESFNVNFDRI